MMQDLLQKCKSSSSDFRSLTFSTYSWKARQFQADQFYALNTLMSTRRLLLLCEQIKWWCHGVELYTKACYASEFPWNRPCNLPFPCNFKELLRKKNLFRCKDKKIQGVKNWLLFIANWWFSVLFKLEFSYYHKLKGCK